MTVARRILGRGSRTPRLVLVTLAVVGAAAGASASYVYAGSSTGGQRRAESASRRHVEISPRVLGTMSPRVLNIIRGERDVDVAVEARVAGAAVGLAPGVSAGVGALAGPARAPTAIPDEVRRFVDHTARMTRTDPAQALAGLRMLRSELGSTRASVYAFRSSSGSPCFVLTGYGGACAQSPRDGMPGLHWTIGGGHDSVPSVLVGIASDDVSRVDLRVDGASVPVSLSRNAVFAEFAGSARQATIVVVHDGGAKSETTFGL